MLSLLVTWMVQTNDGYHQIEMIYEQSICMFYLLLEIMYSGGIGEIMLPCLLQGNGAGSNLASINVVCPSLEWLHWTSSFYAVQRIRIQNRTASVAIEGMNNFVFRSLASSALGGGQYLRFEHCGCRCRCSEVSNINSSLCQRIARVS